jgi:DNA-binding NarL/FixJ family response regulator
VPECLTVVLAEDGALLREGLRGVLDRFGLRVTAAVGDADALLATVAAGRPDLVVTDIRMPPTFSDDGLRAAVDLRRDHPGLPVVVLSQYVESSFAAELLDSGAGRGLGYLLKDRVVDVERFAAMLREVAAGATVVDPDVVRSLLRRRADPLTALTGREREVLSLVAEGHSNSAIARLLFVSEAAVGKHIGNIFTKLRLPQTDDTNRRVLAVLAYLSDGER